MDLQLRDSVALVTGGSDGLGLATARRLLEEGARVAICGRSTDRLAAAAEQLGAGEDRLLTHPADVTSDDDVARLIDAVGARWGRLDALINNAGSVAGIAFEDSTTADWLADLDLKLLAATRTVRRALPLLKESRGAVLNVLSVFARYQPPNTMPTAVSRAAGLALTKGLAQDLAEHGIRVNAALVGIIDSGQWRVQAAKRGITPEQVREAAEANFQIPLGRIGESEEFADVATYLVSPRASYVTGTAIAVDGGMSPVI